MVQCIEHHLQKRNNITYHMYVRVCQESMSEQLCLVGPNFADFTGQAVGYVGFILTTVFPHIVAAATILF